MSKENDIFLASLVVSGLWLFGLKRSYTWRWGRKKYDHNDPDTELVRVRVSLDDDPKMCDEKEEEGFPTTEQKRYIFLLVDQAQLTEEEATERFREQILAGKSSDQAAYDGVRSTPGKLP